MALANYNDLEASVASWLNRTDQSANIGDFIRLAETAIAGDLKLREMVKTATLSGTGTVAIPSDWQEFVYVKFGSVPLEYLPPDVLRSRYLSTGDAKFYSVEGGNVLINPTPGAISLDVAYYERPDLLATSTNAIMTKCPNVYLFKALAFACQFLMDAAKAAQYEAMYQQALDKARSQDAAAHVSGSPLRIRIR